MVGDSLGADVLGGARYGLDTCWFNPDGEPCPSGCQPTHVIKDLRELPGLVAGSRP